MPKHKRPIDIRAYASAEMARGVLDALEALFPKARHGMSLRPHVDTYIVASDVTRDQFDEAHGIAWDAFCLGR